MKRFQLRVTKSRATHAASRPAKASSEVPAYSESARCGRWQLLRTASATIRAGLDVRLCDAWFSPRISTISVAVSFSLQSNPFHQTVTRTHVAIYVLSPPSLGQLVSNPPPLLPPSHSCKRTDRQSANQEHNMHSFTFLCASLPHVPNQSACPTATPVYPRGREHTEVKLPRRLLFEYLSPIPLRLTRSAQMAQTKACTLVALLIIADT